MFDQWHPFTNNYTFFGMFSRAQSLIVVLKELDNVAEEMLMMSP